MVPSFGGVLAVSCAKHRPPPSEDSQWVLGDSRLVSERALRLQVLRRVVFTARRRALIEGQRVGVELRWAMADPILTLMANWS